MSEAASLPNEGDIEYVERELGAHMETIQTELGARLRAARVTKNLGLRELSRRIGVSASMVSQLERGTVMPSVATLYRLVSELGISLDELFIADGQAAVGNDAPASESGTVTSGPGRKGTTGAPERAPEPESSPVQRKGLRPTVTLDTGVVWQRLTPAPDAEVEFLRTRYPVGAESCPRDALLRHLGREYGYVEKGRLAVTVGFETYELDAGDSISFESTIPHRLFTVGDEPAELVWVVIGRSGDPRRPG
jgi:transcriptional regulator with XRE-family HTH domain/mannose-6-phosphate isomerase-like protein (cupin superfamily)